MPEPEKTPDRVSAWIDKDLVKQAKTIGSMEEKKVSEVIEEVLRPGLAKRLRKVADKMHVELGEAGA